MRTTRRIPFAMALVAAALFLAQPAGATIGLRPPGSTIDPGREEVVGDHEPNPTSPLDLVLELEGTGPEVTAHVDLIALQSALDPPDPVQVDIDWGDGTRDTFTIAEGRFELRSVPHTYDVELDTAVTVFAWVTDEHGGFGIESQRILVEAPFTVRLVEATFRPWRHDCDPGLRGQGDFELWWSFEWQASSLSGHDSLTLGTAEPANILEPIAAAGATHSAHPVVAFEWVESDAIFLDPPPATSLSEELPMRPDIDHPDRWETVLSSHGDCQIRIDYRLLTQPT